MIDMNTQMTKTTKTFKPIALSNEIESIISKDITNHVEQV